MDETHAVIESGHSAKSVDRQDVNSVSGHVSGHQSEHECLDNEKGIDKRVNLDKVIAVSKI